MTTAPKRMCASGSFGVTAHVRRDDVVHATRPDGAACTTSRVGPSGGPRLGEGQAHRPASLTLERAMHGARIVDEVVSRPRIAEEELRRQHVGLEAVARRTGCHDVTRRVCAAAGERMHVVERRMRVVERSGAVDATPAAVPDGGELDGAFLLGWQEPTHAAEDPAMSAGERDAVTVSSGQSHLAGKDDTPHREEVPVAGCRAS